MTFLRVVRPLEALATVALVVAATPPWARQYLPGPHLGPVIIAPACLALANNIAAEIRPSEDSPRVLGFGVAIGLAALLYLGCVFSIVGPYPHAAIYAFGMVALSLAHALFLKRVAILGGVAAALIVALMLPWSRLAIGSHAGALVGPAIATFAFVWALDALRTALDPTTPAMISREGCIVLFTTLSVVGAISALIIVFLFTRSWSGRVLGALPALAFAYAGVRANLATDRVTLLHLVVVVKGALVLGIVALALSPSE